MIPRYTRPVMAAIWAPENRYRIWFEIEALAADAMAELGSIPAQAARNIRERGGARIDTINADDVARIDEIERETRHDVIAFLTWLAESVGPDSRFVHLGLTSSDVLDTCLSVQLTQAADILLADIDAVLAALKARAFEHKHTVTIGRSHGIHAEPTSFGLKLAGHYAEFARNRTRLVTARAEVAVAALSGAVGTFAHVDPRVEAHVAAKLGLTVEPISTQVIPRDRHAAYFCALAVIASGIERLATEVRHLQRSEVREAEEFFHPGQKGSSAMPHKRNPVLSENLTGLARLVRSAVVPALENVTLWHERDISHSSVERGIGPDATVTLDFALARLAGMMEKLTIYPERMAANLESLGGVVHSGEVLLALARAGISREDAYRIVQRNAMATWSALGRADARSFRDRLDTDADVAGRVSAAELDAAMDATLHLRELDTVFTRVFGEAGPTPDGA
jgi:adenylosuccinate lyase